jgi:TrmH RNA methyltransferase
VKPQTGAAKPKGERVYGLSAALATFAQRPDAVLSIAHTEAVRAQVAEMLRAAAKKRIAYREVDEEALTKLAQSVHHEGVCLLVRPKPAPTLEALARATGQRGLVLALDGVQNPHNVGAILRSAAYFGAAALLYASEEASPLSAAARRVAEGGAEHVSVVHQAELAPALRQFEQAGFTIVGSDAHAPTSLGKFQWPARSVLVLGHEQRGLTKPVRALCRSLIAIPGSAQVDSLNVSVAAGIFLASYAGAHGVG